MPTLWTGTVEERHARLDKAHRRCDGNGRRCTRAAATSYDLKPARGGVPIEGADMVRKQACSGHTRQFIDSELYVVAGTRKLSNQRAPGEPHRFTIYEERFVKSD